MTQTFKRFRSGLERRVADQLTALNVPFEYEGMRIEYEIHRTAKYLVDFKILPNGIIIETKGRFLSKDRTKHLLIQAQHPELDIRFVFSNSRTKLYKGSKTTYGDWCEKHGFQYADKLVPQEWLEE